jgi:hypothetical protein
MESDPAQAGVSQDWQEIAMVPVLRVEYGSGLGREEQFIGNAVFPAEISFQQALVSELEQYRAQLPRKVYSARLSAFW